MPVDPGLGERLARRVSLLFADAELSLLRRIRDAIREGIDGPHWAARKVGQLEQLRTHIDLDLAGLSKAASAETRKVIFDAFGIGQDLASIDLERAGVDVRIAPATQSAVEVIAADTIRPLKEMLPVVLRAAQDIYQRTVADASAGVLLGGNTRREAAQQALNRFSGHGVRGFVDKAGRSWAMESYAEMAVRTGAGRAAVEGHVTQLAEHGLDLVVVSDAPRECPKCRPWEGKILSISGGLVGSVDMTSTTSDGNVTVRVAGSVADARAAGLQHPNCRHSLSAFLPGATRVPAPKGTQAGYVAQQRQRELERGIRKWKLREVGAIDDGGEMVARAKAREWRAALRAHLVANPELKRQTAREQIGKAR